MVSVSFLVESCNETITARRGENREADDDRRVTLSMPRVRQEDKGKPLYCWFRFEGERQQVVQVAVKNLRAGDYNVDTKE